MRASTVGFVVMVFAAACSAPVESTCAELCLDGCCDESGVCKPGTVTAACGGSGLSCQGCAAGEECVGQRCVAQGSGGGMGGGDATGGGSAGAGGGSAGGAGGGTAGGSGGSGGGAPPAVTVTINRIGATGGVVSWTFGAASGACPGNCAPSAPQSSAFRAEVNHDELSGFASFSAGCGTDPLLCSRPMVPANTTVTASFVTQAGSPQVSSLDPFTTSDPSGPVMSISADADGGFVLAGRLTGTVGLAPGTTVAGPSFVARFDAQGALSWAEHLPQRGTFEVFDVAAGAAGIALGGRCSSSAQFSDAGTALPAGPCVAVFDAAGAVKWAKGWQATGTVTRVALGSGGAVALAGTVSGALNLGSGALTDRGGGDFFFGALDATGNLVLARRGGKGYDDAPGGAAFAANGDVVFSAQIYGGPATFETIQLTQANFQTASFIARYSAAGTFLGGRALNGQVLSRDLLASEAGEVWWVGEYSNTVDFGGISRNAGAGLTSHGVAVKYDASLGAAQWVAEGYAAPEQAALGPDGSLSLAGSFYRYADWGGGYLVSALGSGTSGSLSALLVRIAPDGTVAWSKRVASGGAPVTAITPTRVWAAGRGTVRVGAGTASSTPYRVSWPR